MFECSELSCYRCGVHVFSNLSIIVEHGAGVFVLGSNGSGKTSLLRIISGFLAPYSGVILYDKKVLTYGESSFGSFFYSGDMTLCKNSLTVDENLKFWAEVFSTSELLRAVEEYLCLTKIKDIRYGYLSCGWKKRVSLAVIALSGTDIWMLDEPFVYLDKQGSELLSAMIEAKINGGGSVIIASHDKKNLKDFGEINMDRYKKKIED